MIALNQLHKDKKGLGTKKTHKDDWALQFIIIIVIVVVGTVLFGKFGALFFFKLVSSFSAEFFHLVVVFADSSNEVEFLNEFKENGCEFGGCFGFGDNALNLVDRIGIVRRVEFPEEFGAFLGGVRKGHTAAVFVLGLAKEVAVSHFSEHQVERCGLLTPLRVGMAIAGGLATLVKGFVAIPFGHAAHLVTRRPHVATTIHRVVVFGIGRILDIDQTTHGVATTRRVINRPHGQQLVPIRTTMRHTGLVGRKGITLFLVIVVSSSIPHLLLLRNDQNNK